MESTSLVLQLLSNLPLFLSIWTGIALAWGLFIAVALVSINKECDEKRVRRSIDQHCINVIWLADIVLFAALFAMPQLFAHMQDAMLVINCFITSTFGAYSINIIRLLKYKIFHR